MFVPALRALERPGRLLDSVREPLQRARGRNSAVYEMRSVVASELVEGAGGVSRGARIGGGRD